LVRECFKLTEALVFLSLWNCRNSRLTLFLLHIKMWTYNNHMLMLLDMKISINFFPSSFRTSLRHLKTSITWHEPVWLRTFSSGMDTASSALHLYAKFLHFPGICSQVWSHLQITFNFQAGNRFEVMILKKLSENSMDVIYACFFHCIPMT
jgi:hypothetical protein